jgi:protein O-mannosyl-transferase
MTGKNRNSILIGALLVAVTFFAYRGVLHADFINYDDNQYLTDNPSVQGGLTKQGIVWAFTSGYACNWHPLTWLSHMLDWQLYGSKAGLHHLTNLLIHIANTVLLFVFLRTATGALLRSTIVAAFFALHPVHVESVAWVAERKDVLSTFFWLLTLLAYLAYAKKPGWARYALMLFLFALGLMSKPMVVTLPVILMLLDIWPLRRIQLGQDRSSENSDLEIQLPFPAPNWKRLVLEKLPLLLMAGISCWITIEVQVGGGAVSLTHLTFPERLGNAVISYVRYLGKIFWPQDLAVFYPYHSDWQSWQVAAASILLLLVLFLAIKRLKQEAFFATGWLWYLITLLPVLGLIQVGEQSMADRYTYIPSIGFFIALVWGSWSFLAKVPRHNWILGAGAAASLTACILITIKQVSYWQNSFSLFSHVAEVTSDNAVAQYNLGQALSAQGRLDESIQHYKEALRIDPRSDKAHNNLGLTLAAQGKQDEAVQHYEAALGLNPNNEAAHINYGIDLAAMGRLDDAASHFQRALSIRPNDSLAHGQLGRVLSVQNKFEEARYHLSESLRIDPNEPEAHYGLGMLFEHQGNLTGAAEHFLEATRCRPDYLEAHAHLGLLLSSQGKTSEAIKHYRVVLKIAPDTVEVLNNLAWILAANPDSKIRNGPEAVQLARRACELTGNQEPMLMGTLAAALAEAGQFSEATASATKARDLALSSNQKELAQKNERLLELYKGGHAYHETYASTSTSQSQ